MPFTIRPPAIVWNHGHAFTLKASETLFSSMYGAIANDQLMNAPSDGNPVDGFMPPGGASRWNPEYQVWPI